MKGVDDGRADGTFVDRGDGCANDYTGCSYVTLTPTNSQDGLNLGAASKLESLSHGEVRIVLELIQPVGVPSDRPEYTASVLLETSVVLRDY